MVQKFKGQSYRKLKKDCVSATTLFQDPLFPANDHSLNLSRHSHGRVVWKRPTELCDSPNLFVEKASSKDVTQGSLGNCWFVAACAALATVKQLWSIVVPDYKEQEWDPKKAEQYAGIFHFRFWRFGQWIDVVVDDLLPTIDNQLIFCHSTTENEFWSALLEKAYAKLSGSYGAMDGGNLCDALVDFTSGLSEIIDLTSGGYKTDEEKRNVLRKQLLGKHDEHALMCCAITARDSSEFEVRTSTGLVIGHAYSVTSVRDINLGNAGLLSLFKGGKEKLTMLRLRNPWGSKEWNGSFSDGSPEWTRISKSEKEKLGLTFEDDGEFWMPFEDFVSEFTNLSICHLINTSFFSLHKTWRQQMFTGEWTKPNHSGGCPNNETFLQNPQYCLDIPRDNMEFIVQLMQADTRGKVVTPSNSTDYKSIGFHVMRVEENRKYKVHKTKKKTVTSDYVKARSVFFQGSLGQKGRHVLIPTTFEPNIETEFMLRIFTQETIKVNELKEDYPEPYWICAPFMAPPSCVTVITIKGATGLAVNENTYCLIKVEGQKLESHVVYDSQEPEWDITGVFFRYDVCKPIFVEMWEKKVFFDRFLGCGVITGSADGEVLSLKTPLVGRGRKVHQKHPGELNLSVVTYDELTAT